MSNIFLRLCPCALARSPDQGNKTPDPRACSSGAPVSEQAPGFRELLQIAQGTIIYMGLYLTMSTEYAIIF